MTDEMTSTEPVYEPPPDRTIPGKWVVLMLLTFGVCATGFMWIYAYLSNKPYIPFRHALVQEFTRKSSPRVMGGRDRGRGPIILRILLEVEFDPADQNGGVPDQVLEMERRVAELAREHLDLQQYENWEFILVHYIPEGSVQRKESKRDIAEVLEKRF